MSLKMICLSFSMILISNLSFADETTVKTCIYKCADENCSLKLIKKAYPNGNTKQNQNYCIFGCYAACRNTDGDYEKVKRDLSK